MDYDYPLLRSILEHYKRKGGILDLSSFHLYSCQHLLSPQLEMYKFFLEFGFKPEQITVLGKAYSSNVEVVKELNQLGFDAAQPKYLGTSFDIEHKNNCEGIASRMQDDKRNIILDDGGYLIEAAKTKAYFAVEQTSSGFRKFENESLDFPMFNVARSKTKLTQESPIIARLIFERIEEYIRSSGLGVPKIFIIGMGPIGSSVHQIFKEKEYPVMGVDVEFSKSDILEYMKNKKPDIVIGATGQALFSKTDLEELRDEHIFHLISASSSDREFPVAEFRQGNTVHDDVIHENFIFVNNGFPITFKGNKYESTPIEIEKTIGLLMGSVFEGIVSCPTSKGIIDVPLELEEMIAGQ